MEWDEMIIFLFFQHKCHFGKYMYTRALPLSCKCFFSTLRPPFVFEWPSLYQLTEIGKKPHWRPLVASQIGKVQPLNHSMNLTKYKIVKCSDLVINIIFSKCVINKDLLWKIIKKWPIKEESPCLTYLQSITQWLFFPKSTHSLLK